MKRVSISMRIPERLLAQIERRCKRRDLNRSEVITALLDASLNPVKPVKPTDPNPDREPVQIVRGLL